MESLEIWWENTPQIIIRSRNRSQQMAGGECSQATGHRVCKREPYRPLAAACWLAMSLSAGTVCLLLLWPAILSCSTSERPLSPAVHGHLSLKVHIYHHSFLLIE